MAGVRYRSLGARRWRARGADWGRSRSGRCSIASARRWRAGRRPLQRTLLRRVCRPAVSIRWRRGMPRFRPTATRVISLFMQGGPSQMDSFDPKPELQKLDGQPLPASFKSDDLKLQFMSAAGATLMGSPFKFAQRGESGLEVSELFPHIAEHADRLAVVRSCYHESFIHGPALSLVHSGNLLLGHPSVGSWVVSGLGCESDNLPAFMVMTDGVIRGSSSAYSSGFLPAVYQGTLIRTEGAAIQNLSPPEGFSRAEQRHADRSDRQVEPGASRAACRRLATGGADRQLRAGVSHAGGGAGTDRSGSGNGRDARVVRRRQGADGTLRPHVFAGPADGRARRAVRRAVFERLGRPRRLSGQSSRQCRQDRSADRGAVGRSGTTRPARQHAGVVDRRIRPHADHARQQRPRPQPLWLQRLAGRRRSARRHARSARPTS